MATTIRLTRMGRMKAPFYRLVVVDSRSRRDGDYIEKLGTYNPLPAEYQLELDADRAIHWLSKGAQMSETARSLMRQEGVLFRWHMMKQGLDEATIAAKVEEFRNSRHKAVAARVDKRAAERQAELKAEADAAVKARKDAEAAVAKAAEDELAEAAAESADEASEDAPEAADANEESTKTPDESAES